MNLLRVVLTGGAGFIGSHLCEFLLEEGHQALADELRRLKAEERQAERQRDVTLYDYSYDLVTVKGELYVKNNKSKEITLDIRKTLTGEVLDASHDGRVQKIAEGINLKRVNPSSVITWEVPVKAGAEARLTYKYKVYVAH